MSNLFRRLFIFEMANNHQGSVEHGLCIIDAVAAIAARHGVRAAVKLQYRSLDTFIHRSQREQPSAQHVKRFLDTRLSDVEFAQLVQATKAAGLVSICTPFDERSVRLVEEHGIEIVKVASCSANDWPLLEAIAVTGKPVICSTAGLMMQQLDRVVSFFTHRNLSFAIMHCVGIYPTPPACVNAAFISRLRRRFPQVAIGYSGHESPSELDVITAVVAQGAELFERHVGIPREGERLNGYSMDPAQAEAWLVGALKAFAICGTDEDRVSRDDEAASLRSLMRGVFAKVAIAPGEVLTRDRVYFAMPCGERQTTAAEYHESMAATRAYAPDDAVVERRVAREHIDAVRAVIHEVKGMLNEAKIAVRQPFTVELSHHFGFGRFRETGATIINVINRAYCKKLIVVLPGQEHPVHAHRIKEETFHLLSGDLELCAHGPDGMRVHTLGPGDGVLVEPGTRHSFRSRGGAIVEEVSTTHIKGDSYYDDETINKKDLLERKTVLTNW